MTQSHPENLSFLTSEPISQINHNTQEEPEVMFTEEVFVNCDFSRQGLKEAIKSCVPNSFYIVFTAFLLTIISAIFKVNKSTFYVVIIFVLLNKFLDNIKSILKLDIKIEILRK